MVRLPAGGLCNPAPGRLRGPARWASRPGHEGRETLRHLYGRTGTRTSVPKYKRATSAAGAGEAGSIPASHFNVNAAVKRREARRSSVIGRRSFR